MTLQEPLFIGMPETRDENQSLAAELHGQAARAYRASARASGNGKRAVAVELRGIADAEARSAKQFSRNADRVIGNAGHSIGDEADKIHRTSETDMASYTSLRSS